MLSWVLHQGGSGAILPKIKAAWPNTEYDYVAGWEGSFNGMAKEDWLVPVSVEKVPNLVAPTCRARPTSGHRGRPAW